MLGPDERLWAVSSEAQHCGVQPRQRPDQAKLYCPEILVRPLDLSGCQAEQDALVATAARWELPVEALTWGMLYIDLQSIAQETRTAQPLAVELGQRVRALCGATMQPALGWDSGKFTAHAAAMQTAPGRVRLVAQADEVRFLTPLPVTLLPLPADHLQQLYWLGVRTLGQFAALPAAAVWQRFGAAGRLAHRWAQGKDDRPVCGSGQQSATPITVTIDPSSGLLRPVVEAVMSSLRPALARWAMALVGLRRLRLALDFQVAAEQSMDLTFVEAASQPERVQAALIQTLGAQPWPGQVQAVRWQALETGSLTVCQPTLFDEPSTDLATPDAAADILSGRYGAYLFRSELPKPGHPIAERRGRFDAFPVASQREVNP